MTDQLAKLRAIVEHQPDQCACGARCRCQMHERVLQDIQLELLAVAEAMPACVDALDRLLSDSDPVYAEEVPFEAQVVFTASKALRALLAKLEGLS